jgi:hypothetical protein
MALRRTALEGVLPGKFIEPGHRRWIELFAALWSGSPTPFRQSFTVGVILGEGVIDVGDRQDA